MSFINLELRFAVRRNRLAFSFSTNVCEHSSIKPSGMQNFWNYYSALLHKLSLEQELNAITSKYPHTYLKYRDVCDKNLKKYRSL